MENQMTIKVKSAFKCGLVAGIVIIIIGFGLVPILGNEMNEVLETRSLPPLSNGAMGFFAVLSMLFGISLIWLYVLIQPKFNSKLKAALVAATVFWFYAYFLPNAALVAYGFMPFSLSAIARLGECLNYQLQASLLLGYITEVKQNHREMQAIRCTKCRPIRFSNCSTLKLGPKQNCSNTY
jgi:hypothetical protein